MTSPLIKLKSCTSKPDLARLLKLDPVFLTRVVYIRNTDNLYTDFSIKKKNGTNRIISAPDSELKEIQSKLSKLLQDCLDDIRESLKLNNTISHGFERKKSIITNAEKHRRRKWVLNLDLSNFFDEFNFGRVRGYFLKNKNFSLDETICNLIAKIACYNNRLPQGSPCSPVITNLILFSLDQRLNKICKSVGCTYTRYADDITISTNKSFFPTKIVTSHDNESIVLNKKFLKEITSSGFSLNEDKIRLHNKTYRQEVTGLTVNEFVNVNARYARKVRAMVHCLFKNGSFNLIDKKTRETRQGTINELTGMLGFIDSLDKYNNKNILKYNNKDKNLKHNKREKLYADFLYYKAFHANTKPTILTEGKTDITYLRVALNSLVKYYPSLIEKKQINKNSICDYKIKFFKNSEKTKYFLELDGGTGNLNKFICNFDKKSKKYKHIENTNPVIIILDNDSGSTGKGGIFANLSSERFPMITLSMDELRNEKWIWVMQNLYIIYTPLNGAKESAMEDLFDEKTLATQLGGKFFNKTNKTCTGNQYGKEAFATGVVLKQRKNIDFSGFSSIFDSVVEIIEHHNNIKQNLLN